MASSSDQCRWLVLVSRDRSSAKDTFVYAVKTTKIYCRPSCPSRLARRANIEFYDTAAQAEKAGYRACKRCKPHLKSLSEPESGVQEVIEEDDMLDYAQHKKMIQKACLAIREKGGNTRLKELSQEAGLTPSHFHSVQEGHGSYAGGVREDGTG
jgi:methylphosphotriester-DNA--protein-cysteine methyltransferase